MGGHTRASGDCVHDGRHIAGGQSTTRQRLAAHVHALLRCHESLLARCPPCQRSWSKSPRGRSRAAPSPPPQPDPGCTRPRGIPCLSVAWLRKAEDPTVNIQSCSAAMFRRTGCSERLKKLRSTAAQQAAAASTGKVRLWEAIVTKCLQFPSALLCKDPPWLEQRQEEHAAQGSGCLVSELHDPPMEPTCIGTAVAPFMHGGSVSYWPALG